MHTGRGCHCQKQVVYLCILVPSRIHLQHPTSSVSFELSKDHLSLSFMQYHHLYDGNGSGYLFWTRSVLCMLEKEGLIKKGSLQGFDKEVAKTRSTQSLWVIGNDKGTFFKPDGSL